MVKERIILGDLEFTFSKFRLTDGHDDTIPFRGILVVNGNKLANCSNDGWGGEANIDVLNYKLFDEVETSINGLKIEGCKATMPFIADYLAYKTAVRMSEDKSMENYLVFSDGNKRKYIPICLESNSNVGEIAKISKGVKLIKSIMDNEIKKGFLCINTNIGRFDKYQ